LGGEELPPVLHEHVRDVTTSRPKKTKYKERLDVVLETRPRAYQTDEGSGRNGEAGKRDASIENAASDSLGKGSVHRHQHRLGEGGEKTDSDKQTYLSRE
jgi:hypothetical protein